MVALAACCAAMAIGPQAAMAAAASYQGDLVPPQQGGYYGVQSAIEFKVRVVKKKNGKLVPTAVKNFRSRSVTMYCPNGNTWWLGLHGSGVDFEDHPKDEVRIKKRKFHDASYDDYGSGFYEISGRVPRSGPATGTIRITYPNEAQGGTCDSGVVNWAATRSDPSRAG
jgi:hypothetical protein